MVALQTWIAANGGLAAVIGGGIVLAIWALMNPDKAKALFSKFGSGDGLAGFQTAVQGLSIVKDAKVAVGEVKNIASYAEVRVLKARTLARLPVEQQAPVKAAFETIILALASSESQDDVTK